MELRHLRYFQAVAELLSFSRAAERLRVAQPSLSRQIRDLEDEMGVQLLDRNRVRVNLTDAGRTFYSHTCKILAQVDIAVGSAQEAVTGASGELVICNDWRMSNPYVLAAITEFRTRYPRVEVTLSDLHYHEQLSALRARRAHLGFLIDEMAMMEELESLRLCMSDIMVVVGSSHRLAAEKSVRVADLEKENWVVMEAKESPGLRDFITQICRLSGFTPNFAKVTSSVEGLLAHVATGYGICIVPDFAMNSVLRPPSVRFIKSDCLPIEFRAVWNRHEDSKLLQQFLEILRTKVPKEDPEREKTTQKSRLVLKRR